MSERWICSICGYIHKGAAPPDTCPTCGAPFTAFERRETDPKRRYRRITIAEERPRGFRYVIVGNSAAGRSAARAIRALDLDGTVTVLSEEPVDLYSRPVLPDFIGGMAREDFLATGAHFDTGGVDLKLGVTATAIDRAGQVLRCEGGPDVPYDALLLATGSSPIQVPWPGSEAEGIAYFRTFADAERIALAAESAKRAVVVGGGLLGLEFVRAFHERGIEITMLVREPRVGAPALDVQAGEVIGAALDDWGVSVVLEDEVESFESAGGRVMAVKTKAGKTLPCDIVGVAIGARPRTALAAEAGLAVDRGVLVNARFQTSDPRVYAAGDVAQGYDIAWRERRVVTSWRNSSEQGDFAGICMAGGEGQYPGALAANYQLAAGLPFCAIGVSNPPDPEGFAIEATQDVPGRRYRKLVRRDGELVGACLVGDLSEAADLEQQIREAASAHPVPDLPVAPQPETRPETTGEPTTDKETIDMRPMTKDNVQAAFAGESQAHMKYLNFAKKADEEGRANVARLFRAASFAEQTHASAHLDVMDGIGSTADNLAAAAEGENHEVEEMYPAFMLIAEDQEEFEAHQSFNYAYQAEMQHHAFYVRAQEAVGAGADADFGAIQVCGFCGCTVEGEAPAKCPVCGAPKKHFVEF